MKWRHRIDHLCKDDPNFDNNQTEDRKSKSHKEATNYKFIEAQLHPRERNRRNILYTLSFNTLHYRILNPTDDFNQKDELDFARDKARDDRLPSQSSVNCISDDDMCNQELEKSPKMRSQCSTSEEETEDKPSEPFKSFAIVPEALSMDLRRLVIDLKKESDLHEKNRSGRRGSARFTRHVPQENSLENTCTEENSRSKHALMRLPKLLRGSQVRRKSYLLTDRELGSLQSAKWKIIQLASLYGGEHRASLVQALNNSNSLLKYGRRGEPHCTRLYCNQCGIFQWQTKRGKLSDPEDLADVLHVIDGRETANFKKRPCSGPIRLCSFSIISKNRTLDLEAQSESERDWLVAALRALINYSKKQRQAEEKALAEGDILLA